MMANTKMINKRISNKEFENWYQSCRNRNSSYDNLVFFKNYLTTKLEYLEKLYEGNKNKIKNLSLNAKKVESSLLKNKVSESNYLLNLLKDKTESKNVKNAIKHAYKIKLGSKIIKRPIKKNNLSNQYQEKYDNPQEYLIRLSFIRPEKINKIIEILKNKKITLTKILKKNHKLIKNKLNLLKIETTVNDEDMLDTFNMFVEINKKLNILIKNITIQNKNLIKNEKKNTSLIETQTIVPSAIKNTITYNRHTIESNKSIRTAFQDKKGKLNIKNRILFGNNSIDHLSSYGLREWDENYYIFDVPWDGLCGYHSIMRYAKIHNVNFNDENLNNIKNEKDNGYLLLRWFRDKIKTIEINMKNHFRLFFDDFGVSYEQIYCDIFDKNCNGINERQKEAGSLSWLDTHKANILSVLLGKYIVIYQLAKDEKKNGYFKISNIQKQIFTPNYLNNRNNNLNLDSEDIIKIVHWESGPGHYNFLIHKNRIIFN